MARPADSLSRRVDGDVGKRPLKRHGFTLAIVLCTAAGLAPRLWIGLQQYIEYDGWWHVFISRQPLWEPFVWDAFGTSHPPFFYLVLRVAQEVLGHTRFAYRFVPVVASTATIALLAIIARRLGYSRGASLAAALMFALSQSAVVIACEVRSYSLALLFMMIAFLFLSELLIGNPNRWSMAWLAITNGAAIATHYFAFIFLAVELMVLAVAFARSETTRRRILDAITPLTILVSFPVAMGISALYVAHIRYLHRPNHLPHFYFDPNELPAAFLSRNVVNFVNCFSPVAVHSAAAATAIVVTFAIVLIALLRRRGFALPAAFALLMFLTMLACGLAGAYPFGGALRQQFFIFPFLALALAGAADALPKLSRTAVAMIGLLTIVNALVWIRSFPIVSEELFARNFAAFERRFGGDHAVVVDRFSTIIFFAFTHDRDWKLVRWHEADRTQEYDLGSGLRVIRDRQTWNYDSRERWTFVRLRQVVAASGEPRATLFSIEQLPEKLEAVRIATSADAAGLGLESLDTSNGDVFARFALQPRGGPKIMLHRDR